MNVYWVPGTVLNILHILSYLIITVITDECNFYISFSDGKAEAHGGRITCLRTEMWKSPGFEPKKSSSRAYST